MAIKNHILQVILFIFLTNLNGSGVNSHAVLCTPRQRAAYTSSDRCGSVVQVPRIPRAAVDYCPHCLNGGGLWSTQENQPPSGWVPYSPIENPNFHATASLCGDKKGVEDHMLGGRFMPNFNPPIVEHWVPGSSVDLEVELSANHNGFFEFFLCDLDACGEKDISQECFKKGACYKLKRVAHPQCEAQDPKAKSQCTPIDKDFPERWYVPCFRPEEMSSSLHLVGGDTGYMRYQLPEGVSCERCVLQWYWATANGCLPKGLKEFLGKLEKGFSQTCPLAMSDCGPDRIPEEYWSCADVRISTTGTDDKDMTENINDNLSKEEKEKKKLDDEESNPENQSEDQGGGQNNEKIEKNCVSRGMVCDGATTCCSSRDGQGMVCAFKFDELIFQCATSSDLFPK